MNTTEGNAAPKPLHVLHVLTDTNVGGAGTLLCNLIANADPSVVSYSVLLPAKSRLLRRLSAPGCPCRLYTYPGKGDKSLSGRDVSAMRRVIAALRPDILHTHAALSARIAGRLFFSSARPVICTTHHCVFPLKKRQKNGVYRRLFRLGSRALADGTIAVAQVAKEELVHLGMSPADVRVIVNGVSPVRRCDDAERTAAAKRYGIEPGDFVVGVVARLEPYKGQNVVLRAAEICQKKNPRIRFLFVGDGSRRAQYEKWAREHCPGNCVRFCGFVADMAPVYSLMQVNVNASVNTETASLALSEGMSLGIPAVASDAGGNPDMVQPGVNGELYPAGDGEALSRILMRLADDPAACAVLGEGAKERYLQSFNATRMARETEEFYRELYERKKGGTASKHRVLKQSRRWSRRRESNSQPQLGKLMFYH